MIAITIDVDWAPEEVIEDTLSLFEQFNVKATLFCTHDSQVLKTANRELFELGIHPNFNNLLFKGDQGHAQQIVDDLMELYPEATSVRSHSMTSSTPMSQLFRRSGLLQESNIFIPYNFEVKPYSDWNGLLRVPYNWEDDIHFMYQRSFKESVFEFYRPEKHYVLDFHPIHVFLNTESEMTYQKAKPHYHNASALKSYVNKAATGTRDFLINALNWMNSHEISGFKMNELNPSRQS